MKGLVLDDRGVLALGGPDARDLLQGLLTNDVRKLAPGKPLYAALLTPQGKFLFDMILFDTGEQILADVEAARRADLLKRLTMYRLRASVTLEDASATHAVAAFWDGAPDLPAGVWGGADPRLAALGTRAIGPRKALSALAATGDDTSLADWTAHRLQLGVPEAPSDMVPGQSFWLETNAAELHGVDFRKGCYVGQELTARMHHKTELRKRLLPVLLDGPAESGAAVLAGDREVGQLHSVAGDRAMALLRLDRLKEAGEAGTPVTAGGKGVSVAIPDWLTI